MMRYVLACVVLFIATTWSVSADKPAAHVMFADWLEQQTATAAPAPAKTASGAANYYDHADMETVYLKQTAVVDCRCVGCTDYCGVGTTNTESCENPTCCATLHTKFLFSCVPDSDYDTYDGDKHHEREFFAVDDMTVGNCETVSFAFNPPVAMMTDNVLKLGSFQSVCTLDKAGKCGHPFCDDMILEVSGMAYGILDAVSATNASTPAVDDSCGFYPFGVHGVGGAKRSQRGTSGSPWLKALRQYRQSAGVASQDVKKAPVADTAYYHHEDGPTYFKSDAALLSGVATITSRKYNLKYREGFIDLAEFDPVGSTAVTKAEAAGKHLIKPYIAILQMKKPSEQY